MGFNTLFVVLLLQHDIKKVILCNDFLQRWKILIKASLAQINVSCCSSSVLTQSMFLLPFFWLRVKTAEIIV